MLGPPSAYLPLTVLALSSSLRQSFLTVDEALASTGGHADVHDSIGLAGPVSGYFAPFSSTTSFSGAVIYLIFRELACASASETAGTCGWSAARIGVAEPAIPTKKIVAKQAGIARMVTSMAVLLFARISWFVRHV